MVKILWLIRILCEEFAAFSPRHAHEKLRAVRPPTPRYLPRGPEINFHSFPHKITFIFVLFVKDLTVFISFLKFILYSLA